MEWERQLQTDIDNSERSVLSSSVDVKARKNITVTTSTADSHVLKFDFKIKGSIDQSESMISSTAYTKDGFTTFIADEHIAGNTETRNI